MVLGASGWAWQSILLWGEHLASHPLPPEALGMTARGPFPLLGVICRPPGAAQVVAEG